MDRRDYDAIIGAARLRAVMPAPRPVRRATARMERPRGRKATKAARRVAAWNFERARDAIALVTRTIDARRAAAGRMPHAARTEPRLKIRHSTTDEAKFKLKGKGPWSPTSSSKTSETSKASTSSTARRATRSSSAGRAPRSETSSTT